MYYLLRGNQIILFTDKIDEAFKVQELMVRQMLGFTSVINVTDEDEEEIKKNGNKVMAQYDITIGDDGLQFNEIDYPMIAEEEYDAENREFVRKYQCGFCGKWLTDSDIGGGRCPRCHRLIGGDYRLR